MRRTLALLLLAQFSFSLIAPTLGANTASSNLPACCRKDGKHHCAMAEAVASESPSRKLAAPACPLFPKAGVATALFNTAALHIGPVVYTPVLSGVIAASANHTCSHATLRGPIRKRGPPATLN